jgi:hypothetical protein
VQRKRPKELEKIGPKRQIVTRRSMLELEVVRVGEVQQMVELRKEVRRRKELKLMVVKPKRWVVIQRELEELEL